MRSVIKYISRLAAAAAVLLCAAAGHAVDSLDWIVAIVNEEPVLYSELKREIDETTLRMQASGREIPAFDSLYGEVLDRLIEYRLKRQRANSLNVNISAGEIERSVPVAVSAYGVANEAELLELLEISAGDLRQRISDEIAINRARFIDNRRRLAEYGTNLDAALRRNFADQMLMEYDLFQIQLPPDSQDLAAELKRQATSEEDFRALAKSYSIAPSAGRSGYLGWQLLDRLPVAVVDDIAALSPGAITEPIELPNGIHLFKLNAVRPIVPGVEQVVEVCMQQVTASGENAEEEAGNLLLDLRDGLTSIAAAGQEEGRIGGNICAEPFALPASVRNPRRLRIGTLLGPFPAVGEPGGWTIGLITDIKRVVVGGDDLREEASSYYQEQELQTLDRYWTSLLRSIADIHVLRELP